MRLQQAITGLTRQREALAAELAKVTTAIRALRGGYRFLVRRRRVLSAAARNRIAAAQKARWAKWRAQRAK